jgi:hypothetical protein
MAEQKYLGHAKKPSMDTKMELRKDKSSYFTAMVEDVFGRSHHF